MSPETEAPVVAKATETTTHPEKGTTVTERSIQESHASGFLTSQFWLSVLGAMIGFALCYHAKDSMNEYGVWLVGSCVLGYTVTRNFGRVRFPFTRR